MDEQGGDSFRRKVMRTAVGGVSAALLLRAASAQASDKMTAQQAQYQATPNGIYGCAVCTLFEPPKGCNVVEGEVSKDGWYRAFALAD